MGVEDQANAVADYYDGHPMPPSDGATPEQQAAYDQMLDNWQGLDPPPSVNEWMQAEYDRQMAAWQSKFGPGDPPPPPEPPTVPGPPTPGAGMPAARIGDLCAHGGAIVGPGCPTVLIGFMPAVRGMPAMDQAACPMFNGPVPHATGTILKGSTTVMIGYMPAARVSDPIGPPTVCAGNAIALGCPTVLIGDQGGGGSTGGGAGGGGASGGGGGTGAGGPAAATAQPQSTYAETAPAQPAVAGPPTQNVGTGTHWLEIEMVDEAEQPVVGERYTIRLPDAKEVSGGLDDKGRVRITGIQKPGSWQIRFPNLDMDAWHRWAPKPLPPPAGSTAPPQAGPDEGPVPKGSDQPGRGHWHSVLQGECMSSIGKDHGLFWSTIWNHAANAELKHRRGNPNVLLPHDAVFLPNPRPKGEGGATDQHHKFRRRGEPACFRMKLLEEGEPRADAPYILEVDGQQHEGVTDAQGLITQPIPGNARRARLLVGPENDQSEYLLGVGELDPVAEIRGVQGRLQNLGYDCGALDGILSERTRKAIARFQRTYKLAESGTPDTATREKLVEVHGD